MNNTYQKKFRYNDKDSIKFFVKNGYVIYEKLHDDYLIKRCEEYFTNTFEKLVENNKNLKENIDVNGFAVSIIDRFSTMEEYNILLSNEKLLELMRNYLGPDIALLGYCALWINIPQDKDPVLLKTLHTDAWTGTSINTIFSKIFFTDVDDHNSMGVCPGSHLQGLIPVRNRTIDPKSDVNFETINLNTISQGDTLIWHPLLIHSTIGHSDKNTRISMTSRYSSTETNFSSQERSLGYKTLSVGPLNQILRMVGSDNLMPFRTYGGYVGIDRRMEKIYPHSDYKIEDKNYKNIIKDIKINSKQG